MNIRMIDINNVEANKDQPRKHFDDEKLAELAISIAQYGVLQPIIVSDNGNGRFKIIAGERRYRASIMAGLKEVPVVVSEVNRYTADKISIIENVQRDDLSAIEEAIAYKSLIETYELSQTEVGKLIGKKPSTISNKIRLLKLNDDVKQAIASNQITERHGRAMLNLDEETQVKYLEKINSNNWTVKDLERDIEKKSSTKKKPSNKQKMIVNKDFRLAVNTLKHAIDLIEKTGMNVEFNEELDGDDLLISLKLSRG